MKIIISILLFTLSFISSYCQTRIMEKNYYWHKSKNQKITAFVLLGTGAALYTTGVIVREKSLKANGAFLNFDGLGYSFLGVIGMLSSIPFFDGSLRNKRKTIALTLIDQKYITTNSNLVVLKPQPALAVKFNF